MDKTLLIACAVVGVITGAAGLGLLMLGGLGAVLIGTPFLFLFGWFVGSRVA